MNNRIILYMLLIVSCLIHITEEVGCNTYFGPNGAKHCIKLLHFDDYQWATCRKYSYIRRKTNNKHWCQYFPRGYCYVPCMVEKYGEFRGNVYGDCRCSPGSEAPLTTSSTPTPTSSSSHSLSKRDIYVIVGSAIAILVPLLFLVCFIYQKGKRGRVANRQIAPYETADGCREGGMPWVMYFENRPPPYAECWIAKPHCSESRPPPYNPSWLPLQCENGPPSSS